MFELLIITLLFWFVGMFYITFLWKMMQDGEMFDILFKWGKLRNWLYAGTPFMKLLENAIGGCAMCTAFWWSLPWACFYFCYSGHHFWTVAPFWIGNAGIAHWYLTRKHGM
jgi:hypothetical protein